MGKNDYGASHWSSDKVWERRKTELNAKIDHPELEPAIAKVMQLLKDERLTLGQMMFVLVKVEHRLMLPETSRG
ncbi:hypothetical protein [Candidatus Methanoperedens nitratireducens]|uniref:Uncharacterized protein n=1 Tax=Candidatus Methanoperedens nitratireducens TaxID=1392998 RepID=A0A284VRJ6_9EURY|nr:hypothetical protein [Candidatus Methanoperedens nitroreducens]SNQ61892.1 hypothetical protein MNV_510008 [Candidatus Methanoperedens nitroreducens]